MITLGALRGYSTRTIGSLSVIERKGRQRAEREHRITEAARLIAEGEGWSAVTIRRLADEIEYSQPVLYAHFRNRDAIVAAVAVEGFQALTMALRNAARGSRATRNVPRKVAMAYLDFARRHPALYDAMFVLPTNLDFAKPDTRAELKETFSALAAVVAPSSTDVEVATETFWAVLHGLAALERSGRIRLNKRNERVTLAVRRLFGC